MTISTTTIKNSYSGNGSTTVFNYTFKVTDQDDIEVIIRSADGTETTKTISTHYNVSGVGNANGGSVTFTGGNVPTATETVVLRRDTPQTQGVDLIENDPLPANTLEDALDKVTSITQELQEESDRSIKLSRTNTMTSTEFTVDATNRANKILAFDSAGEIAVTQELGIYRSNWSASTSYNVRDIVKDTSTNNIFIANTAHTSSGSQPLTTNTDSAKWDLLVDAASATTAQTAAAASATAAANSATAAATSESNAATSESNASTSETNAATSATTASTAATNAGTSETNAATSETNASTSATAAASSATSAASSATTATTQASAASTSATNAATSESNASTSETNAATSASNAATSETNAATSATTATTQATNAATSATSAASSATAAQTAQTAAELALDNFTDIYLGDFSSAPTTDNDGDPLAVGMMYYDTSTNQLKIYSSSGWQNAGSSVNGTSGRYTYTISGTPTSVTGADDDGNTLAYDAGFIDVYLNGVKQVNDTDVTVTSGDTVTFASALANGDIVDIVTFGTFNVAAIDAGNISSGTLNNSRLSSDVTQNTATQTLTNKTLAAGSNTISGLTNSNLSGSAAISNANLANSSITLNGSAVSLGGSATISAGTDWQAVKTADFTAVAGEGYFVDTTSGAITVTLPSSPSIGDEVIIADYAGTADTNNITIARNGSKILGAAANRLITTEREVASLVFIDGTQGWIAYSGVNEGTSPSLGAIEYTASYLVVAGGGGGGGDGNTVGGAGGGAGGYRNSYASETSGANSSTESTLTLGGGIVYTITVGAGGTGNTSNTKNGSNGGDSSIAGSNITTVTSVGGGLAAHTQGNIGTAGGSGGGSSYNTSTPAQGTANQGKAGGTASQSGGNTSSGGGGGGASANGGNSTLNNAGSGGAGLSSSITGSAVSRAGGGGAGSSGSYSSASGGTGGGGNAGANGGNNTGGNGTANTGGGGGGSSTVSGGASNGGNGGSGVVILRMPTAKYTGTTTGSPTVTTDGTDTILAFTGSGTYTG